MTRCDECERFIAGTPDDPVHALSRRGILCLACLKRPAPTAAAEAPKVDGRGAAARARWEAMTPEQRAERVRRMQAGRVR